MMILLAIFAILATTSGDSVSVLYPRPSESRHVISLDGIWDFSAPADQKTALEQEWHKKNLRAVSSDVIPMPVPASYNDMTEDKAIRDHVGLVWYQRKFFVPSNWGPENRIWIRFGSVCYSAQVWVNGEEVGTHEIGHLPFQLEVTSAVKIGEENLLTVTVDNTLLETTIPQGSLNELNIGDDRILTQAYTFDFFNYAGIDRSVFLFATPAVFITDLSIATNVTSTGLGTVEYTVEHSGDGSVACSLTLSDAEGTSVATAEECAGLLQVEQPKLWWPNLMDPNPGYLYSLKVVIQTDEGITDVYRQKVGIRTVSWTNTSLLLNNKPVYIRGFGRHEDSDIRGKGLDLSLIVKDHSLIKWLGGNAYRTSHYPYAEEIMDMADELGIMIIDECPSVNTDIFSDTLKRNHQQSLTELIRRDKNRPSVIMWSIANEPRSMNDGAGDYFRDIAQHVKSIDTSRPITIAFIAFYNEDLAARWLDIISVNRYNSWYSDTGRTEVITQYVIDEVENWNKKFDKPILFTEYGADAVNGLHSLPEFVWSEEYQTVSMGEHFKAFDELRSRGYFIGEMIWNFADFMTAQTVGRVGGNRKGIFTRQRQPKASAHLLRKRYWALAEELDGATPPSGVFGYTSSVRDKLDL